MQLINSFVYTVVHCVVLGLVQLGSVARRNHCCLTDYDPRFGSFECEHIDLLLTYIDVCKTIGESR